MSICSESNCSGEEFCTLGGECTGASSQDLPVGMTLTENGALAYKDLGDDLLKVDSNSLRDSYDEVSEAFGNALRDPQLKPWAIVLLFRIRDILNGKGERVLFRKLYTDLLAADQLTAILLIKLIPEFGYWKDLVQFYVETENKEFKEALVECCSDQLREDLQKIDEGSAKVSLVAKWLPRESSGKTELRKKQKEMIRDICRVLGYVSPTSKVDYKKYRKALTKISGALGLNPTIESILAGIGDGTLSLEKCLELFKPGSIPSVAINRLRFALQCLEKNGDPRKELANIHIRQELAGLYKKFLEDCSEGKATIKAQAAQPTDIAKILSQGRDATVEAQVTSLIQGIRKNAVENPGELSLLNAMAVVDVSGSMFQGNIPGLNDVKPGHLSIFLGYILSQLAEEPFRNKLITFSGNPSWINVAGTECHYDAYSKIRKSCFIENTDLLKTFDLILTTAEAHSVPQEKMIKVVFVFSDMQFDVGVDNFDKTIHEQIRKKYEDHGYQVPLLVYWNLQTRQAMPVHADTERTLLMSGFSPNLFKAFVDGTFSKFTPEKPPTPKEALYEVLSSDRYAIVRSELKKILTDCPEDW